MARETNNQPGIDKPGLYTPGSKNGSFGGFRGFLKKKKRWVIGGVAGASVGGGGLVLFFLFSQVFMFVNLGQILGNADFGTRSAISTRMGSLLRNHRAIREDDVGEHRVGALASRRFNRVEAQLRDAGIEFQRRAATGRPTAIAIDTTKNPEFRRGSLEQKRAAIAKFYNIDVSRVSDPRAGRFFDIDMRGLRGKQARSIAFTSLRHLENGAVPNALNKRVMAKFFSLPSLFHPIKRLTGDIDEAVRTRSSRIALENERKNTRRARLKSKYNNIKSRVSDKLTPGRRAALNSGLLVAGSLCFARETAELIPLLNYAEIEAPSMIEAVDKQAIDSQIRSGLDTDLNALAAADESLIDDEGGTIWEGKALDALASGGGRGEEIGDEFKQAFAPEASEAGILGAIGKVASVEVAGVDITGVICSPGGLVIQFVANTVLVATGPGGWAAKSAQVGRDVVVMTAIMKLANNILADTAKDVVIESFAGPQGGNLLAYGARASANLNARAMGGVELSQTEETTLLKEFRQQERREFGQKSLFARAFDIYDHRSMISGLLRSSQPDPARKIPTALAQALSPGRVFANISSLFSPKVSAQEEPYDWSFPLYGVPRDILLDDKYEDPYENADKVTKRLNNNQVDFNRVKNCFGVEIGQDSDGRWNAIPVEDVNPRENEYRSANCGDLSDEDWARTMLFVFDTSIMTQIDCYEGGQESCKNLGVTSTTSAGGRSIGDAACPADMSDSLTSPDGSKTIYRLQPPVGGEYTIRDQTTRARRKYGTEELVCAIHTAGVKYHHAMGGKSRLEIWDLTAGSPHVSHLFTVGVDLIANGEKHAGDHVNDGGAYDTQATIELGKALVDTKLVKNIWWCDPGDGSTAAIRDYAISIGSPVNIECISGHANHFHVDVRGPKNPIYCPPGDTFRKSYSASSDGFDASAGEACDGWR